MSIFDGYIYPADSDILYLEYFKDYFEAVFVCFNPFFKMPDEYIEKKGYYLSKEEIQFAEIITWEEIKEGCNLNNFSEMAIALETYSGGLNSKFKDENLSMIVKTYCNNNKIFMPSEGNFADLIYSEIKKVFEVNGYEKVILQDEFGDRNSEVFVNSLEEELFHDYNNIMIKNIYSPDKKILFTIDWDSHYFLFCASREIIEKALKETKLEGFFSFDKTCHHWELYT